MSEPAPLSSVHTTSLPALLEQFGISVLITTYQAGKLIAVRADGGTANTHFRTFDTPMGLAHDRGRLALGTRTGVWEFHNQPAAAAQLEPPGRHDACFLPRSFEVTGHIAIHEIAWAGDELWVVNTRFSCLCTLDRNYSFVPRWRPPFVSALVPEDRCHLNGMCLEAGRPRFVTALGATDESLGWRTDKAGGGVLIEVPSGRVVAEGLCMPHSPRLTDRTLWFLESGGGTVSRLDQTTGRVTKVSELPGFTRGLDFYGPYAFVGLSQVRQTALFSGLPITERLPAHERCCGLWVVDTRTGQTVAFLKFLSGVQEIFAVQVIPHRYPELLNEDTDEMVARTYVLPGERTEDVPNVMK